MKVKINLTNQTLEYLDSVPYIQGTDSRNKLIVYVPTEVTNIAISYQLQNGRNTIKMSNSGVVASDSDDYLSGYWGYIFVAPKALTSLSGNFMASVIITISTIKYKINVLNTVLNSVDFEAFETALEEAESEFLDNITAIEASITALGTNKADKTNYTQDITSKSFIANSNNGKSATLEDDALSFTSKIKIVDIGGNHEIESIATGILVNLESGDGYYRLETDSFEFWFNDENLFKVDEDAAYYRGVELVDTNGLDFQLGVLQNYVDTYFVKLTNTTELEIKAPTFKVIDYNHQSNPPLFSVSDNNIYITRAGDTSPTFYRDGNSALYLQFYDSQNKYNGMQFTPEYFRVVSGSNSFEFNKTSSKFTIPSTFDYYKGTQKIATEDYVGTQITTAQNTLQSEIDAINAAQNLADIVADLAALNSLDTSKLHSGDKVQVLVDSDHDNASTVYNWNGSAWSYIGQYGQDSYTKSESDNKFVPKTAIKQVSSNSTTDVPSLALFKTVEDRINIGYLSFDDADFTKLGYLFTKTLTTDELAEINKGICVIEFSNLNISGAWGLLTKAAGSIAFRNGNQYAVGTTRVSGQDSGYIVNCECRLTRANPTGSEIVIQLNPVDATYNYSTIDTLLNNKADLTNTSQTITAGTINANNINGNAGNDLNIGVDDGKIINMYIGSISSHPVLFATNDYVTLFAGNSSEGIVLSVGTGFKYNGNTVIDTNNATTELFMTDAEMTTLLSEVFN